MEDQQIIALYFQRQEQAIQETDRKYGRLCHGIAVNVLSDRQDSEECVNDTYLAVWHQIPPTRPMSFRAFLCGITRNLALKKLEWRQAAKRRCPVPSPWKNWKTCFRMNALRRMPPARRSGRASTHFWPRSRRRPGRSFYGATGILILWQTLPAGTASPRAR